MISKKTFVVFVFSIVFLSGCSVLRASADTLEATVLDAETGKPISGAVVLGVWLRIAGLPGLHHHELIAVKEVVTDQDGRFELEQPAERFDEENQNILVYKPGYVAWNNEYVFPNWVRRKDLGVPEKILLDRFPPNQSHERHMRFIEDRRASVFYGDEEVPRFLNAIRPELKKR